MKHLPISTGSLRRKAIGGLVLVVMLPAFLASAAHVINDVFGPFIPWAVAGVFLYGLYSLVVRRYRR